jgi:hypothetical protein
VPIANVIKLALAAWENSKVLLNASNPALAKCDTRRFCCAWARLVGGQVHQSAKLAIV